MPETRQLVGGITPSTSYPEGRGHVELEAAIIRPYGTNTRTVKNTHPTASCEFAVVANDGTVGAFTTVAAQASTTVTLATGPKFFRPLGSAGPIALTIDLP